MKLDVHTISGDVFQVEAHPRTTIEEIQAHLADACKVPVLCQHLALTLTVDMEPATKLLESKKQAKQIEGLSALAQLGCRAGGAVPAVGKIAMDPVLPHTLVSKAMDTLQSIAEGNAAVLRPLLDGSVTAGLTFEIPVVCDGLFAVAAFDGRKRMVELVLEAGADVNENSGRPLRAASKGGQLEVVDLLLRSRADANAADARIHKTANASTALMMAAERNHRQVAIRLLESGANVKASDRNGAKAFHYAYHTGHAEMTALLQDGESAEELKQTGNTHFKKAKHKEALACWAGARATCEKAGVQGHQSALLLANEAQCRLNMGDHEGARKACETGLQLCATEHIREKLQQRLAKCSSQTGPDQPSSADVKQENH